MLWVLALRHEGVRTPGDGPVTATTDIVDYANPRVSRVPTFRTVLPLFGIHFRIEIH